MVVTEFDTGPSGRDVEGLGSWARHTPSSGQRRPGCAHQDRSRGHGSRHCSLRCRPAGRTGSPAPDPRPPHPPLATILPYRVAGPGRHPLDDPHPICQPFGVERQQAPSGRRSRTGSAGCAGVFDHHDVAPPQSPWGGASHQYPVAMTQGGLHAGAHHIDDGEPAAQSEHHGEPDRQHHDGHKKPDHPLIVSARAGRAAVQRGVAIGPPVVPQPTCKPRRGANDDRVATLS